ncbi:MAG: hypothetical protein HY675_10575 [Chloroflexi bacterium]|nr:hypothetical protein [Chloroflexota bacterium]
MVQDPSAENIGALVVDIAATAIPVVPGGAGTVVRATKAGKRVAQASSTAGDVAQAVKWVERFAGADEAILRGVRALKNSINSGKIPQFRHGWEAQLRRAEEYYKAGKLKAIEFIEGANRYDLLLDTGQTVEVKYWRESYAGLHKADLAERIRKYQAAGRDVILEFVKTKTGTITASNLDDLHKYLTEIERINITRDSLRLVD